MTGVVSPARKRSWSWSASSRVSSSCSSTASAHRCGVVLLDQVGAQPLLGSPGGATGGAGVLHELARTAVQDAPEVAGLADRPGEGSGTELDLLLDEVHQLERRQPGTVPLVDHRDHRDAAQRADLEELEGLRLEPLAGVDQHHRGVDRRQHPVGVLGEVAVAGGVDEVDHVVAVDELQRGRGDRDAARLLHRHPVGHRGAPVALAVDGSRLGDHPRVQGEGLGQGGLARVGVADDGEGTAGAGVGHRANLPGGSPDRRFVGSRPSPRAVLRRWLGASCRGSPACGDRGAGARGLRGGDAGAARHPPAPRHVRRAGRLGADLVQPRAGARRGADGGGLRAGRPADPRRCRHRGVRRRLGVVRGGAVDRGADRGSVRAGARRRAGAGRVPRAAGRRVRRAPRDRRLDHRRCDRHGHRPGRGWAAHAGVLVAGDLRGAGADRRAGGAGGARGARRTGPRARPAMLRSGTARRCVPT